MKKYHTGSTGCECEDCENQPPAKGDAVAAVIVTMVALVLALLLYAEGRSYTSPLSVCQKQCSYYLNTTVRIGNVSNIYSCSCDNR